MIWFSGHYSIGFLSQAPPTVKQVSRRREKEKEVGPTTNMFYEAIPVEQLMLHMQVIK